MKTCSKCAKAKPLSEFHRNKSARDGRVGLCKPCARAKAAQWLVENRARGNANSLAYAKAHKTEATKRTKQWRERPGNRERRNAVEYAARKRITVISIARKERRRAARKRDAAKNAAIEARRRAAQLQATPSWLSAIQRAQIQEFYDVSVARTTQTGIAYNVDHIHPLKGHALRGLHVPWNLQILSAHENQSKNARVDYTTLTLASEPSLW